MGVQTYIEWADHTFNPWIGCMKVSAGCANCYAEADAPARVSRAHGVELWGKGKPRRVTSAEYWRQPFAWDREAKASGVRRRVFCASQADVFEDNDRQMIDHEGRPMALHRRDDWRPAETIAGEGQTYRPLMLDDVRERLFRMIAATPNLDWLLLTKRPENIARLWPVGHEFTGPGAIEWPNVWLGTSVEDQAAADERIPHLLNVPAAVRFLSCEPLLGPVDLRRLNLGVQMTGWGKRLIELDALSGWETQYHGQTRTRNHDHVNRGTKLHWVIVGGESGDGARPMRERWVLSLRDQCRAANVPFFFKQWGNYVPDEYIEKGCWNSWNGPKEFKSRAYFGTWEQGHYNDFTLMARVGKKAAGRMLDGREWNEIPEVAS